MWNFDVADPTFCGTVGAYGSRGWGTSSAICVRSACVLLSAVCCLLSSAALRCAVLPFACVACLEKRAKLKSWTKIQYEMDALF